LRDYLERSTEATEVATPPKERCERLSYRHQFHIDVPSYFRDTNGTSWVATESDVWEMSDPEAFYEWFLKKFEGKNRDRLRRSIRYLKMWAALHFKRKTRPSSIFLTTLATYVFEAVKERNLEGDDKIFCEIIRSMYDRLEISFATKNPVNNEEDLNNLKTDDAKSFLEKLKQLRDIAERALESTTEVEAAIIWAEEFGHFMQLPEETTKNMSSNNLPAMLMPDIAIEIYAEKTDRLIRTDLNEVHPVPKGCELRFRIADPALVPFGSTIEWVVRNAGREAESVNDLGHRRECTMLMTAEERTRYHGLQYMDCTLRRGRQIVAFRRVPVHIQRIWLPARNPKPPGYVALRRRA
jgi:Adenylyl/Guanylyl and SMODS C-terminal sensor domain/Cyclic GMP-AMP synthase, C-terminal domain